MEPASICLICGTDAEPTVEHIIPQALWRRFDLNPNARELERYRTQLCEAHNRATSALHNRPRLLDLIEIGTPLNRQTLTHLGDWAVWVTLLMGLRTGLGVLKPDESRRLLRRRFDKSSTGLPRGVRVYAARVENYVIGTDFISHQVAVEQDDRVVLDHAGVPIGVEMKTGPIKAVEAIGIGKIAMLVLSRTFNSGSGHHDRLDVTAATVGLERIHPLPNPGPTLYPKNIDMRAVSDVFCPPGHGDDLSLLPPTVRTLMNMLVAT